MRKNKIEVGTRNNAEQMNLATKMATTLGENYSCALDNNTFKHDLTGA